MPFSAIPRSITRDRRTARPQRTGQRPDKRANPAFGGEPWGSAFWPAATDDTDNDLTPQIWTWYMGVARAIRQYRAAPFNNLAALKADATYGDGNLAYNSGADFTAGQFVFLRDGSIAHYDTGAWVAGAA